MALRSLGRRYRGIFAGLGDDESPDDLAHRMGPDGGSAIDHVVGATRTITFLDRALEQVLSQDDPSLHPAVAEASEREWGDAPGGTVDDHVAELAREADRMADRADRVPADAWQRTGRVADRDATVSASALLWDAVDSSIEHLKAAERTLAAVRGREG